MDHMPVEQQHRIAVAADIEGVRVWERRADSCYASQVRSYQGPIIRCKHVNRSRSICCSASGLTWFDPACMLLLWWDHSLADRTRRQARSLELRGDVLSDTQLAVHVHTSECSCWSVGAKGVHAYWTVTCWFCGRVRRVGVIVIVFGQVNHFSTPLHAPSRGDPPACSGFGLLAG
uniref:Uncharacterized protein n=1 Tax=Haptolina brevifila TaxID=156173 RepID=A0A7S2JNB3_9EUKA|mmetsp:Transcript_86183/g.172108  ORF Transcript_86183/g.172108 Transcript_86183/m.172108 type:complete len:175 (+) Transcript_86183:263-787(+)